MKTTIFLLLMVTNAFAQSKENPSYPIIKFKKNTVKLWQYPEAESSIKVKSKSLGNPTEVAVIGFAGGSKEHIIITYQEQPYSLSRSKVVLKPEFDKRHATGISCTESNLGKNEKRAETTSVCERQ